MSPALAATLTRAHVCMVADAMVSAVCNAARAPDNMTRDAPWAVDLRQRLGMAAPSRCSWLNVPPEPGSAQSWFRGLLQQDTAHFAGSHQALNTGLEQEGPDTRK